MRTQSEDPQYRVVVNDEEQYSIWPAFKDAAPGWHDAGVAGDRETCLAHIREVWQDMRPRSLREQRSGA